MGRNSNGVARVINASTMRTPPWVHWQREEHAHVY
jgi:hypothetical protein